jgi:cell division transport system permease protein
MKNIGATDAYIRWPYIIEGFTLGVFAAILAGVLVVGGYDLLLNRSAQLSNNYSILGLFQLLPIESMIYDIGLIFILVGSGVGVIASFFSTRKYLNV